MTQIQPLGDRVLIKLLEEPRSYTAAKILVVGGESATRWATVTACGEDARLTTPGDTVLVNTLMGKTVGSEAVLVVPERAILATR